MNLETGRKKCRRFVDTHARVANCPLNRECNMPSIFYREIGRDIYIWAQEEEARKKSQPGPNVDRLRRIKGANLYLERGVVLTAAVTPSLSPLGGVIFICLRETRSPFTASHPPRLNHFGLVPSLLASSLWTLAKKTMIYQFFCGTRVAINELSFCLAEAN